MYYLDPLQYLKLTLWVCFRSFRYRCVMILPSNAETKKITWVCLYFTINVLLCLMIIVSVVLVASFQLFFALWDIKCRTIIYTVESRLTKPWQLPVTDIFINVKTRLSKFMDIFKAWRTVKQDPTVCMYIYIIRYICREFHWRSFPLQLIMVCNLFTSDRLVIPVFTPPTLPYSPYTCSLPSHPSSAPPPSPVDDGVAVLSPVLAGTLLTSHHTHFINYFFIISSSLCPFSIFYNILSFLYVFP